MRALFLPKTGRDAPFEIREIPEPTLRPGHLLVRVAAASVNPIDCKLRIRNGPLMPRPPVLGADFAGTVEAVADDVTGFAVGDDVYGCGGGVTGAAGGSFAEHLLVDADLIAKKPQSLGFREAAAVPLVALTAWQGLHRAGAGPGKQVLIRGAAGGVGHFAVQLAQVLGCEVTACLRDTAKSGLVRELGADHIVSSAALPAGAFDIVFDAAGLAEIEPLLDAVRLGGDLVLVSGDGAPDLPGAFRRGLSVHFVLVILPLVTGRDRKDHGDALAQIARLIDEGRIGPLIDDRRFTLETAADAFRLVEGGKSDGKIVMDIRG